MQWKVTKTTNDYQISQYPVGFQTRLKNFLQFMQISEHELCTTAYN